jgi:hypothetical protein
MSKTDEHSQLRDGRGFWFIMLEIELVRNGYWEAISLAAKAVYVVLVSHANRDWQAFPGVPLIAKEAGLTQRSVITAIKDLEAHQLISVERHAINHKGSRYTILPIGKHRGNDSDNDSEITSRENTSPDASSPEQVKILHPKQNQLSKAQDALAPPLGAPMPFPLPSDFAVTTELRAAVADLNLSATVIDRETAKFVDHYTGTGECSLNWPGKWRNWMRREIDFRGPRRRGRRTEAESDPVDWDKYKGDGYLKVPGRRS